MIPCSCIHLESLAGGGREREDRGRDERGEGGEGEEERGRQEGGEGEG